jgi:YEATS domain-containing protein 4
LKLHPYGPDAPPPPPPNPDGSQPKPIPQSVESYVYDELVFNEPTEGMFEALTSRPGALLPAHKSDDNMYTLQTEAEELERLSSGLETVYQQVQKVKERIQQLEHEKEQLQPSSSLD